MVQLRRSTIVPDRARSQRSLPEVLCVYREVKIIQRDRGRIEEEAERRGGDRPYDEKPGIQAIATTGPDLPPEPGGHATFAPRS
jgi:hypothetical protein